MKRHLRRFGKCAGEHEQQDRQIQGIASDEFAIFQERRNFQAAAGLTQEQHTRKQRQSTRAGHQQSLQSRGARRFTVMIEADQKIRADAGQLPEHV